MTEFNPWSDLMPHRIKVQDKSTRNDYAEETWDASTEREYHCLIDMSSNIISTAQGEDIAYGIVVYVFAIPIGATEPKSIGEEARIVFDPAVEGVPVERPVDKVDRAYDETGKLHNMTLMFS